MKMFVDVPDVYLCQQFVDFRKSINGLAAIVETELELNVLSGTVFVFCNKAKDKLKILYWDKTGFAQRPPWMVEVRTTQEQLSSTNALKKTNLNGQLNSILNHFIYQSNNYIGYCRGLM